MPAGRLPDSEHFHELGFAPHSTGIVASLELLHSRPTESVKTSQLSPGLDPDWRAIIFHRACPAALDSLQGKMPRNHQLQYSMRGGREREQRVGTGFRIATSFAARSSHPGGVPVGRLVEPSTVERSFSNFYEDPLHTVAPT